MALLPDLPYQHVQFAHYIGLIDYCSALQFQRKVHAGCWLDDLQLAHVTHGSPRAIAPGAHVCCHCGCALRREVNIYDTRLQILRCECLVRLAGCLLALTMDSLQVAESVACMASCGLVL